MITNLKTSCQFYAHIWNSDFIMNLFKIDLKSWRNGVQDDLYYMSLSNSSTSTVSLLPLLSVVVL